MKTTSYNRSFLKWPGGKYQLLPHILRVLPRRKILVEPFVGSGVVFLNAEYESYWINDVNQDLMAVYRCLQEGGKDFIAYSQSLFCVQNNDPNRYYAFREEFNTLSEDGAGDPFRRSALFLYLNRHGYNGLCRYNQAGRFNVPFGRYHKPYFPEQELNRFVQKIDRVFLSAQPYDLFFERIPADAVVYCDPPYAPLKQTQRAFTAYAAGRFALSEQERLATLIRQWSQRGWPILVSNHDTPWVRRLYAGAQFKRLQVRRHISCQERRKVPEILAYFNEQDKIERIQSVHLADTL